MREIKFRGKNALGRWIFTNIDNDDPTTIGQFWALVDRETVGEYIGSKDSKDKEIYEGDIVRGNQGDVAVAEWEDDIDTDRDWRYASGFSFDLRETIQVIINGDTKQTHLSNVEVIGNIYEHPGLLEREETL